MSSTSSSVAAEGEKSIVGQSEPTVAQPKIKLADQVESANALQAEINLGVQNKLATQGDILGQILAMVSALTQKSFEEDTKAKAIVIAEAEQAAAVAKMVADDARRRDLGDRDKQARTEKRDEKTASQGAIKAMFDFDFSEDEVLLSPVRNQRPTIVAATQNLSDESDIEMQMRWELGHLTGMGLLDSTVVGNEAKDQRNVPPRDAGAAIPAVINSKSVKPKKVHQTPSEALRQGVMDYGAKDPFAVPAMDPLYRESTTAVNFRTSVLISAQRLTAEANRRISQDTDRPAVQIGEKFRHAMIYTLDHHILQRFYEKVMQHDSNPANDRAHPGKHLEPFMLRRMHDRMQAFSNMPSMLADHGLSGMIVPSEEMLKKMEAEEFFGWALKSLIPVTKPECEATVKAAMNSLTLSHGFQPDTVLTTANIDAFEGLMEAKVKLMVAIIHDGGSMQYSRQLNADGTRKECKTWPGSKSNADLRIQGIYRTFFAGPGFPAPPKSDAGAALADAPMTLRQAIAEDSSTTWYKTDAYPIYLQDFVHELGRVIAGLRKFHLLRRIIASYTSAISGVLGNAASAGVPMMHQTSGLPPTHKGQPATPPHKPPDPSQMTQQEYSKSSQQYQQQSERAAGTAPPWRQGPQPKLQLRSSDTSALVNSRGGRWGKSILPQRSGTLNLMHEVRQLELDAEDERARFERLEEARELYADLLDEHQRAQFGDNGLERYAEVVEGDGYYSANEDEDHRVSASPPQRDRYAPEEEAVLHMLANLPMDATSSLPATVRQRIEGYRSNAIERDNRNEHRNDSAQWQSQRNSAGHNPGRLSEPQKRVTFTSGAPPRGACTAFLKGQCTKGDSCAWSHDWDAFFAEADRIAQNVKAHEAKRPKTAGVASMSTNSQQMNHTEHGAGSSGDPQEE